MATHPYFVAKARIVFHQAGGNPDDSTALAAWAQTARDRDDVQGVIVARDGTLIAETGLKRGAVTVTYVAKALVPAGKELVGKELGYAMGGARREVGTECVHVKRSEVCYGSGDSVRRQAAAI